jgi:hypothetical protein
MSKKIKPEELQDLTTDELRDVVEGAIVEILGDELIIVETPELVKLEPPKFISSDETNAKFISTVLGFKAKGYNHNAIGAMMGIDSDLVKEIFENGR